MTKEIVGKMNGTFSFDAVTQESPSRKLGVSFEDEMSYRLTVAKAIVQAGHLLQIGDVTSYTAVMIFQRFYMLRGFPDSDRWLIAHGCLLIASKMREDQRRIRDIMNAFHRVRHFDEDAPMDMDTVSEERREVERGEDMEGRENSFDGGLGVF
eukprot:TRINITY_DN821_c0_g7_i1.p1 TRINITY_DN821_c0_g7~~TRINITY_DN821_c0_g7_i1.p1  ORF type:complete len:153 (+),score=27.39 TRINITY_DN821_c0_g7_i1:700-1158(+)